MTEVSAPTCCPECGGQGPWTAAAELRCENCGATVDLRPVLVVTDEMVEVHCQAAWGDSWDGCPDAFRAFWRKGERAGLEAVATMLAGREVVAS